VGAGANLNRNSDNLIRIVQSLSAIAQENAASTEEANASVDSQNMLIEGFVNKTLELKDVVSKLEEETYRFEV